MHRPPIRSQRGTVANGQDLHDLRHRSGRWCITDAPMHRCTAFGHGVHLGHTRPAPDGRLLLYTPRIDRIDIDTGIHPWAYKASAESMSMGGINPRAYKASAASISLGHTKHPLGPQSIGTEHLCTPSLTTRFWSSFCSAQARALPVACTREKRLGYGDHRPGPARLFPAPCRDGRLAMHRCIHASARHLPDASTRHLPDASQPANYQTTATPSRSEPRRRRGPGVNGTIIYSNAVL